MIKLIETTNFKIYALFSFSEFINYFDNYQLIINQFLNNNNNIINKIFIGLKIYCINNYSYEVLNWK